MKGRIGRSKFFVVTLVCLILTFLAIYIGVEMAKSFQTKIFRLIIKGLALGIGYAAVKGFFVGMVQRLHDCNRTGWWALLVFIPYVDIAFLLALMFYPGTKSANKYGA